MEVLISMGILVVGLLCVAAMIPAGRFELLQGAKVDHATMVGRAAFRELKIRGYLNPANWYGTAAIYRAPDLSHPTYWFDTVNTNNDGTNVTPAVAIDPLGLTAVTTPPYGPTFPYGAGALSLARIYPDKQIISLPPGPVQKGFADLAFRNSDDLTFVPDTTAKDRPPVQSPPGAPTRGSDGNYSWLATIVTDPTNSALASKVTVSVAVFYRRDLSDPTKTEAQVGVTLYGGVGAGLGGGEVQLTGLPPAPSKFNKGLKPGYWIMLAGTLTSGTLNYNYFRWYRVVAADVVNGNTQNVSLAGADWNPNTTGTQAWLFEDVIAVYEKNMRLEVP